MKQPQTLADTFALVTGNTDILLPECAFACNNGKCLVDSADICNSVDDCGDMSDETELCSKFSVYYSLAKGKGVYS